MQLELGNNIRQLRRRDKRTQEALAEALGVTAQAVSRWESGGSCPDMNLIPSIANYFGVSIDELFGYTNQREQKIDELAEEKAPCDGETARQAYRTMAEDWPWWTVPEVEQVKDEIQADPRWAEWVARTRE